MEVPAQADSKEPLPIPKHGAEYQVDCSWNGCDIKTRATKPEIGHHMKTHHRDMVTEDDGHIICLWGGCGKKLLATSLDGHISTTHTEAALHWCPYYPDCKKEMRKDSAQRHFKSHHGPESKEEDSKGRKGKSKKATSKKATSKRRKSRKDTMLLGQKQEGPAKKRKRTKSTA